MNNEESIEDLIYDELEDFSIDPSAIKEIETRIELILTSYIEQALLFRKSISRKEDNKLNFKELITIRYFKDPRFELQ